MSRPEYRIRTAAEQRIEAEYGMPVADVLRQLYQERRLSQAAVARRLGVHRTTVVEWMARHGIEASYNRSAEAVA